MKNIILLTGLVALALTSCEYEPIQPEAAFIADADLVVPNEVISFQNTSYHADYYEWNFGDGHTSNRREPSHYYDKEGIYSVTLKAHSGSYVDYATLEIEVYETTLEIEVVEYETGDIISYADVGLYANFYDWENFNAPVITARADYDGIVVFKGLDTYSYFIDASTKYADNEKIGYEDNHKFIKTLPLLHARHNTFKAYVDYIPVTLKSANDATGERKVRKPVLRKIQRSVKDRDEVLQSVK